MAWIRTLWDMPRIFKRTWHNIKLGWTPTTAHFLHRVIASNPSIITTINMDTTTGIQISTLMGPQAAWNEQEFANRVRPRASPGTFRLSQGLFETHVRSNHTSHVVGQTSPDSQKLTVRSFPSTLVEGNTLDSAARLQFGHFNCVVVCGTDFAT